ncbi:AI-2E family transporter [Acidimangrovimonas sediminis]|uniref:AI-2E family transporter n=1 Tax=Acidimangrovimonas sediminis TaxID=2056283 RepID=UPI000C7FE4AB|nr:AI-2E family transporter [Acidimangrovimonas sediminis]
MALTVRDQLKYWGAAAAVFLLALWFLGSVMLPFLVGGAIAYFLDPVADRLEALGLSRTLATVVISVVALMIFIVAGLLIVPLLVQQLVALINEAPQLFDQLQKFLTHRFPQLLDQNSVVHQTLISVGETIKSQGGKLANSLLTSAMTVISAVVFIVVVPVVAFYLLLDWDRMVAHIDSWLPREHRSVIRRLAGEIDDVLAGFVRGQLTVCLILGTYYALGLMLVGLQFGLIVGAIAGFITFIPYLGAITGGSIAIGLALFQYWDHPWWIAAVAGIFAVGQTVEGNFLTPKLVGHSVGLHPVWLLFALSAFGTIFGFVGMLVAVPVAATLGVLARFGVRQYMNSLLYRGIDAAEEPVASPGEELPRPGGAPHAAPSHSPAPSPAAQGPQDA